MIDQHRTYVEARYDSAIAYYWQVGTRNKRAYKWSRYLMIALGSTVTLVASMSSASFLKDHTTFLGVLTPVLAALLTMLSAFSQSFQWGASWREMVLTAERLQSVRDRIAVTPDAEIEPRADLEMLNRLVLTESRGFFDRVMGSSMVSQTTGGSGAESAIAAAPKTGAV